MQPVTLDTIAKEAGVHRSTVSRALRGSPRISQKKRKEILWVAERLGYKPDPHASSLAEGRWRKGHRERAIAVAYITGARNGSPVDQALQLHLEAKAACAGYQLLVVRLTPGITARTLSRELWAKGVRAVILGPAGESSFNDWKSVPLDRYAGVALNRESNEPALHRVMFNAFKDVIDAIEEISRRGFNRIAFIASTHTSARVAMRQLAAITYLRETRPALTIIMLNSEQFATPLVQAQLAEQVDVLLYAFAWAADYAGAAVKHLPYASLGIWSFLGGSLAGMRLAENEFCETAIDLMDFQIRRGAFGIPLHRHTLMVDNHWQDGTTLQTTKPQATTLET